LNSLNLVGKIECLFAFMHNYFAHSPKCHLEASKLAAFLEYTYLQFKCLFPRFLTFELRKKLHRLLTSILNGCLCLLNIM
jgi:hypothetical protein